MIIISCYFVHSLLVITIIMAFGNSSSLRKRHLEGSNITEHNITEEWTWLPEDASFNSSSVSEILAMYNMSKLWRKLNPTGMKTEMKSENKKQQVSKDINWCSYLSVVVDDISDYEKYTVRIKTRNRF